MNARKYEAILGFFEHDDPKRTPASIGALRSYSGNCQLSYVEPPVSRISDIDTCFRISSECSNESPNRWATFRSKIVKLNQEAQNNTHFKVFFLGRHGQGYHNVATNKYGTKAWDDYWSKHYGDSELTWGPDPDLTDIGIQQANDAHDAWVAETQLEIGIPLPEKLYCSPMTRALHTHLIIFDGIVTSENRKTTVLENCREIYGGNTCNKRKSRTHIHSAFPQFEIEDGFAEEDELWTAQRESEEHLAIRAKAILDRIFDTDVEQFISITAHRFIIDAILGVAGHHKYHLATGGVLPIVIKRTTHTE